MRSLTRVASATLVIAVLVSGCSSSSDNKKDASSQSSIPPTTKLTDLTPAQVNQVCLEQVAGGPGAASCADGGANSLNIGVCGQNPIQSDCTATVATSQTCMAKLTADVCNYKNYAADLTTPECLVMLACTQSLCVNSLCFCPDNNSLSNCEATCRAYTKGLTTGCASCVAGVFASHLSCPDFTMLPAPYDQCASSCP
jgi:hypothetical protein